MHEPVLPVGRAPQRHEPPRADDARLGEQLGEAERTRDLVVCASVLSAMARSQTATDCQRRRAVVIVRKKWEDEQHTDAAAAATRDGDGGEDSAQPLLLDLCERRIGEERLRKRQLVHDRVCAGSPLREPRAVAVHAGAHVRDLHAQRDELVRARHWRRAAAAVA